MLFTLNVLTTNYALHVFEHLSEIIKLFQFLLSVNISNFDLS